MVKILLVSMCWFFSGAACDERPPAFSAGACEGGRLSQRDGIWVLELEGSAAVRGRAHGTLLKKQIRWLLPAYSKAFGLSAKPDPRLAQLVEKLRARVPAEYLEELAAMAEAAGIDAGQALAVNLSPELYLGLACSVLVVTGEKSADGRVRMARNLDWQGGEVLHRLGLVIVESGPAGEGRRVATFGFPGLVGAVTGMNDAGVAVADLMVLGEGRAVGEGIPVTFLVRRVLEKASSVPEAVQLITDSPRTICQNYALADPRTGAVVESCPAEFRQRAVEEGFVAVTNWRNEDRLGKARPRFASLCQAARQGALDGKGLQEILAAVALDKLNIQAVVLEPAGLKVQVAGGSLPAAGGTFRDLDLSAWLGEKEKK